MTLLPGTKVGGYEVVSTLGRGGMGEVYRAHDSKLHRDVALKVLPEAFAASPDRLARFQREAQVLASLNHPHIAAIYGLEEGGAASALVLELVEGPTLADRIALGPIPVDEARIIAEQIAQALEAAHEQGIVHRDLKPSNIKVKDDGSVKVLDFGLAKALGPSEGGPPGSHSPTITASELTERGSVVGTAPYMSPEQATGRAVDKRSDIWAFGCVLYEMLTGKRAFPGDDRAQVLAAVMGLEPDWDALPGVVPPAVVTVLKRCLQKDPVLRTRDVADARFQIQEGFAAPAVSLRPVALTRAHAAYVPWVVAAVAVAAAVVTIGRSGRRAPAGMPETRLSIMTPPADDPFSLAISPDGRRVVFRARREGRAELWLRPLEQEEARPLPGTEGALSPFWSPDSRSVGFFADGMLKRIDLTGKFVRTVTSARNPRRGAWSSDGTILFSASTGPLWRVSAEGGPVQEATHLLPGQTNHRSPQFLTDGRRFLFFALGPADVRGVYLGGPVDERVRRLLVSESAAAFLAPAHLLLARDGALWAQRLGDDGTHVEGELIPVAPRVMVHPTVNGYGGFSSSSVGSIAYRASAAVTQLVWLDRAGRLVSALGQPDDTELTVMNLSPDGRTAAAERTVNGNTDVWLVDTEHGVSRRVTFDPGIDGEPIFSPDGKRIVFVSDRKKNIWDMYERNSDGTGGEALILESEQNKQPRDWSPDGRYILYASQGPNTDSDLWALPLFGDRTPMPIARTPFAETTGRFSPDGRWVAYESNENGRSEIYVQPFPRTGPKMQASVAGGRVPRWRRDGRELFYLAPDHRLVAVSITNRGSVLDVGAPKGLFTLPGGRLYEPSRDGQRFLTSRVVSDASPITVILGWKPPGP